MRSSDLNVQTALVEHADKIEYTKLVAVYKINKEYVSIKRLDKSPFSMSVVSQQLKLLQLFIRKFKTLKRALLTVSFFIVLKSRETQTVVEIGFVFLVVRTVFGSVGQTILKSGFCSRAAMLLYAFQLIKIFLLLIFPKKMIKKERKSKFGKNKPPFMAYQIIKLLQITAKGLKFFLNFYVAHQIITFLLKHHQKTQEDQCPSQTFYLYSIFLMLLYENISFLRH